MQPGETAEPPLIHEPLEESSDCFLRAHFQDRFLGKSVPKSQTVLEKQLQRDGRNFTLVSVKNNKQPGAGDGVDKDGVGRPRPA